MTPFTVYNDCTPLCMVLEILRIRSVGNNNALQTRLVGVTTGTSDVSSFHLFIPTFSYRFIMSTIFPAFREVVFFL